MERKNVPEADAPTNLRDPGQAGALDVEGDRCGEAAAGDGLARPLRHPVGVDGHIDGLAWPAADAATSARASPTSG
ncbi:hypothetical protein U9M48_012215 [Paspalum notatum var. saurae]|uniref:Uncharacterized protein n=1 Tax=Paspalum notatum var. saurae TaxID=547442 RepID=A0AAQ3WHU9_PASNO